MDHGSSSSKAKRAFRFIQDEVKQMEEKLKPCTTSHPDRVLMRELALKFSESQGRVGTTPVTPKQVLNWFRYRRYYKSNKKAAATKAPPPATGIQAGQQRRELTVIGPVRRQDAGSSSTGNNPRLGDPASYEAKKSACDGAWYDVDDFLTRRLGESGDLEVMVHYSRFEVEEAEWINARTSLRQRSLPCNTTECEAVKPRDTVLCYKSGLYDAVVDRIIRKVHDSGAPCDCRFLVRYVHDRSEEYVPLRKLCLRPEKLRAWHEQQNETNN